MRTDNINVAVSFNNLKWDTEFFGIACAKAILHRELMPIEWEEIKGKFSEFKFISIVNQNSDPSNSKLIGRDTTAFLADTNLQFSKKVTYVDRPPTNITIHQSLEVNDEIVKLSNFKYSKFIEDAELKKRGGENVYRQWLINSFGQSDKHFVISKDEDSNIDGYLLHCFIGNSCTIELVAVSERAVKTGIGTRLFKALEFSASIRRVNEIKVGTQARNINAINFYHKVGCKQVSCHQVYHLWNLDRE